MKNYKMNNWFVGIVLGIFALMVIGAIWSNAGQSDQSAPADSQDSISSAIPTSTTITNPIVVTPTQPRSHTPVAQSSITKSWHTVMTLSGSGQENTAPFTIQGLEWRVDWTETLSQDPASFCEGGGPCIVFADVVPAGQTQTVGDFSMSQMTALGTVTGTSYEYIAPGSYYLFINPDFSPQWSVSVEDYY